MDVGDWLRSLGLGQYEALFRQNDVDAEILGELTDGDLEKLGVSLGHRKRLLKAIARLGDASNAAVGPSMTVTRSAASAERRQLTVMFCDLVGSTALAGRLDPEDMSAAITAYQKAATGAVTRFQGHVAKYMGDGILCYFGWPNAHEDDAERAVRSGFAIMAAMRGLRAPTGEPLSARIGIATGLVVVGDLIGAGAAQEEAVVGETPNLAARLQGLANPGDIILAEATRRLLGDLFMVSDLGPQRLKGIGDAVPAYRVIGERAAESRFEARASGAAPPIVGRDHELALILERAKQAWAGEGQAVLLSGEAGIGKSRVTRAIIDAAAGLRYMRLSYQCSPYHSDSPLYPAIQQLNFAAGVRPEDSNDDRLDRLEAILVGDQADRVLFGGLLGLETSTRYGPLNLSPQQQRARTLQALVSQLILLSQNQPVLFVVEDAHWIDATTLELIDLCLDRVASARVMMLVTGRPNFQHSFGGHPIVTKLALNRLGREQVRAIVERITNGKRLPAPLVDLIAAKTDGVPLFVEEITKTVLESGMLAETDSAFELSGPLSHLAIPSTLYDSLMARLDRLQPIKEVAQTAACIGRDFDYQLLKSASPLDDEALQDALDRLVRAELIFRRGTPPEATYMFKHALVRDAAYENLLKTRRQAIHARLLDALATQDAAPELLAHHAAAAGMIERASRYWLEAGERASARSANKEAINHLRAGIHLLEGLPETPEIMRLKLDLHSALVSPLMVIYGYGSEEGGIASRRAVELCRAIGEPAELSEKLWQAWVFNVTRGNNEVAAAIARELIESDRQAGDPTASIGNSAAMGISLFMTGNPVGARARFEQAAGVYNEQNGGPTDFRYGMEVGALASGYLAWALAVLGSPVRSIESCAATAQIMRKATHPYTQARGSYWCSAALATLRDWRAVLAHSEQAIRVADEHDFAMVKSISRVMRGTAQFALAPTAEAIAEMRHGLDAYCATGARLQVPFLLTLLAEALRMRKDWEGGLQVTASASAMIAETGELQVAAEVHRIHGRILHESGAGDAEPHYVLALEVARSQTARLFELRACRDLAQLLRAQGRLSEARDALAGACSSLTEGFDTPDFREAKELQNMLG